MDADPPAESGLRFIQPEDDFAAKRLQRLCMTGSLLLAAVASPYAVAQTVAQPPSIAASAAPVGKPEKKVLTPSSVAASAVPVGKPEKKILTPSESRDSATAPGDLRPERRVTPQVTLPLTQAGKAVPAKSVLTPPLRANPAPSGGIDDAAARCGALVDAQARDQCREKLAR